MNECFTGIPNLHLYPRQTYPIYIRYRLASAAVLLRGHLDTDHAWKMDGWRFNSRALDHTVMYTTGLTPEGRRLRDLASEAVDDRKEKVTAFDSKSILIVAIDMLSRNGVSCASNSSLSNQPIT